MMATPAEVANFLISQNGQYRLHHNNEASNG